jgi:threonine/homoserine/homoserine lactone efflux protein
MPVMPDTSTLLLFTGASLALLAIPGPAVLFLVARSVDQGRGAGLVSMLGVETGTFAFAVAAALGLTGLLAASELGFTVVKYAGAAYLVYLGLRKLLERTDEAATKAPAPHSRLFLDGLLVQLLNPKIAVFFLAFLPQFVDPAAGHVVGQTLLLGTLFTVLAVLSDGACALLAGTLGGWLRRPGRRRRLARVSGGIYLGLGVSAALTGRPAKG